MKRICMYVVTILITSTFGYQYAEIWINRGR
jgi:hypothetical protein